MIVNHEAVIEGMVINSPLPRGLIKKTLIALCVGIVLFCHFVDAMIDKGARLYRVLIPHPAR